MKSIVVSTIFIAQGRSLTCLNEETRKTMRVHIFRHMLIVCFLPRLQLFFTQCTGNCIKRVFTKITFKLEIGFSIEEDIAT